MRASALMTMGALVFLALLGWGAWFYQAQRQELRRDAEMQLEAVARLKADQIAAWREERLDDAAVLMERLAFIADAKQRLAEPSAGASRPPEAAATMKAAEETLRRFRSIQKHYRYHDILLVDPDGRVRLSLSGYAGTHHVGAAAALAAALRERKPVFTELHTEVDDPVPHIGVVAPLFSNQGEAAGAVGAVMLVSDARAFLFPLIQSWPVPSRTAESLLVRRDGDHVLFLNDLRHRPDTALKLRIPLSRQDVPAVKAVLGLEGVYEGKDYRGVEVLGVLKAIPHSPWFMVAKIDIEESFAVRRFQSTLILLLLSGLASLAGLSLLLLRQREGKAYYRALYQSEAERRRSEERHGITLRSIGDGVIGADAEGRVELLNPVAEALTGWTEAEARGRPVDEIFRIINEETRETVENPVARVLREGVVVGLANHTLLISRDGGERPIADSGAPILDDRGAVTGVVLVFRDQTEERAAMEALRTTRREWQATFDAMLDPVALLAPDGTIRQHNQAFASLFEGETGLLTGRRCFRLIHKTEDHITGCPLVRARRSGAREDMELPIGDRTFLVAVDPVKATSGELAGFVHIMRDITGHKRAEATILKERDFIRAALDSLPGLFYLFDEQGRFLRWNRNFERVSGYSAEEIRSLTPLNLFEESDKGIIQESIRQVFVTGESFAEAEFMSKDRTKTSCYFTGNFFRFQEKPCLIGMGIDITERKRAEETLRESEDRFRRLFDIVSVPLCFVDKEGVLAALNDRFIRTFGYTHRDVPTLREWSELAYPDPEYRRWVSQTWQDALRHALEDKTDIEPMELRMTCKSGEVRTMIVSGSTLGDSFLATFFDITERKRSEETLRESEDRYRDLVESSQDLICTHDLQGRLLTTNAMPTQLLGYTRDELLRMNLRDILVPRQRDNFGDYLDEIKRSGSARGLMQVMTKNGERRIWEYHNTLRSEGVKEPIVRGMAHDVTEQKRAEHALRESETLFRRLFEHHAAVKLVLDPETGNIIDANDAAAAFYGWPREQLRQMKIHDINTISPEEIKEAMEKVQAQEKIKFEFRHRRADGSIRDVEVFSSKIEVKGKDLLHSVIHDITERKRAEEEKEKLHKQLQQAQKMESVGRLAGGVAHDFNNMLGIILGYTEMALLEASPGTRLHNSLQEVRKAADRSADLTRQLLAFARKQTIDPKVLDLNATVEGMLRMLRRLIGEDIDLAWLPGPALWPVKMDPAQVDQVLANLCVNARDAIAGVGKVTIETGNVRLDEAYCAGHAGFVPGDYVLLAVSDNGCGMDEETMKNLFDPFFTTKEVGKGTGLGLATVYGIVKQNNGFINVYSEPGRGTTFKIYLPRHGDGVVEAEAASSADFPLGRGETVLIVEDEPAMLAMGKVMLEKLGYTVLGAADPGQALRLADEYTGDIHLLMTDVVMPRMNGRDLAERLMPGKPGMKCLFMSGYTANVIAHHGVLDEGVHFIQKPFSMKDLGAKVREALDT
jgi:PAS domain S-box-containing protein